MDLADLAECLAVVLNRMTVPGGGTGGALTGGRTLDEDPEDFGADDCLRDTGAALKRTGLGVAVGPCGGVTGALAGAGGGFGTSALVDSSWSC